MKDNSNTTRKTTSFCKKHNLLFPIFVAIAFGMVFVFLSVRVLVVKDVKCSHTSVYEISSRPS